MQHQLRSCLCIPTAHKQQSAGLLCTACQHLLRSSSMRDAATQHLPLTRRCQLLCLACSSPTPHIHAWSIGLLFPRMRASLDTFSHVLGTGLNLHRPYFALLLPFQRASCFLSPSQVRLTGHLFPRAGHGPQLPPALSLSHVLILGLGSISCRRASLDTFSHVLGMDLNFHLHRKTGELLRIMDRGGFAVDGFSGCLWGRR